MMGFWFPLLLVLVVATLPQSQAFSSPILQQQPQQRCFPSIVIMEKRTSWMKMSTDSAAAEQQQDQSESSNSSSNNLPDIPSMRVKEIQAELKERSVSYADCFDKESLAKRLQEARENPEAFAKKEAPTPQVTKDGRTSSGAEKNTSTSTATSDNSANSNNNNKTLATKKKKDFNREETLSELRAMKVRELREACAKRQIRWGQFVEKEDFIQALIVAMEKAADFSVSGQMEAGKVTELTGDQLEQELSQPSEAPLLLDIFATWCGTSPWNYRCLV